MRGSVIAAALALSLASGCDSPFELLPEEERRVLVHAILDMAADTQRVMIEWTSSLDGNVGILGANVRVIDPDGQSVSATTRPVVPVPRGWPARYIFLLSETFGTLRRGGTYTLEIDIPELPRITGTTTIPDTLATQTVQIRTLPFPRDRDTLRLQWAPVRGAAGYQVMSTSMVFPSSADPTPRTIFTGTSIVLPGTLEVLGQGEFFPRNHAVDVVALAVDDNYLTYYKTASDPFAGAPPSRLTGGAIGLFGAIVPIQRYRLFVQ